LVNLIQKRRITDWFNLLVVLNAVYFSVATKTGTVDANEEESHRQKLIAIASISSVIVLFLVLLYVVIVSKIRF
jgi:heme/copper-type cytochrome/quinol oxidase subunit 2